jgi:hypothetical protein
MRISRRLACLAMLALLTACASKADYIRTRAASDFSCAAADVRVESRGSGRFHAVGCDQQADYACINQGVDFTCVRDH